jgi:hypothetical protein
MKIRAHLTIYKVLTIIRLLLIVTHEDYNIKINPGSLLNDFEVTLKTLSYDFDQIQQMFTKTSIHKPNGKNKKRSLLFKANYINDRSMNNILLFIILLCGDVEVNPGPSNLFKEEHTLKCPFCHRYVRRLESHVRGSHKENLCEKSFNLNEEVIFTSQHDSSKTLIGNRNAIDLSCKKLNFEDSCNPGPSIYNSSAIIIPQNRDPKYIRPFPTVYSDDSSSDESFHASCKEEKTNDNILDSPPVNESLTDYGHEGESKLNNHNEEDEGKDQVSSRYKNKKDITSKSDDREGNNIKCPFCGGYYKETGLNIHISKAHPDRARKKIMEKSDKKGSLSFESITNPVKKNKQTLSLSSNGTSEFDSLLNDWFIKFKNNVTENDYWDNLVSEFTKWLAEAIHFLPGPKHPARLFYEARKHGKSRPSNPTYQQTSNPIRKSKRDKEKRKAKYDFQLTQFLYYNQRKKAVRKVLNNENKKQLKENNDTIYEYFNNRFSIKNYCKRTEYNDKLDEKDKQELNENYGFVISKEDIFNSMRKMNIDTAPGPDRVVMRTVKHQVVAEILAIIANRMLETAWVPNTFKEARTILVHKKGPLNNLDNWRPISVTSVLRRIIERTLDKEIRRFIVLNENQRGFSNTPGCQININILYRILEKARNENKDATMVFLDVEKAFDNVGHEHLLHTIKTSGLPNKLQQLICNLITDNTTQIQVGLQKTKPIKINKGVLQGSPLSPLLFNVSTDHILEELSEEDVAKTYGFLLDENVSPISVLGFADDTVLVANSDMSADFLLQMATHRFKEIGLKINYNKSNAIIIKNGKLTPGSLGYEGNIIKSISEGDTIKYLGVNFSNTLCFDSNSIMKKLYDNLDSITKSLLLSSNQKLNIINQYISPTVIYPLQNSKLHLIPKQFLNDGDRIIRSSVKEILQLPSDTPNSFLYSDKNTKGLNILRLTWEAYIQQYNNYVILERAQNKYLQPSYEREKEDCLQALNLSTTEFSPIPKENIMSKHIRKILKEKELKVWCQLPQKGKGVTLYNQVKSANFWLYKNEGLSDSEWRDCLKMTCNIASVRTVPGRGPNTTHCRHCNEYETLAHVLGSCKQGELLRNKRHNAVREILANELKKKGLEVHQEVHCLSESGSTRRVDILAIDREKDQGWIIDPTVRFEDNQDQPEKVNQEKQGIYEPTVPFFNSKYKIKNLSVIGLMFGSRGTLTSNYIKFRKNFKIHKSIDKVLVTSILKNSVYILRNHLYNKNSL